MDKIGIQKKNWFMDSHGGSELNWSTDRIKLTDKTKEMK